MVAQYETAGDPTANSPPQAPPADTEEASASPITQGTSDGAEARAEADAKSAIKIDPTKDLWQNIALNVKEFTAEQMDQTVLVVGSEGSGKSSVINRILGSTAKTKPTTALEYSYGKREDHNNITQIAHHWELAQGKKLAQLSDVVITAENIHTFVALVVVDCSNMGTMWDSASFWLSRLCDRTREIFEKMDAKGSSTPGKMRTRAWKVVGENHPDISKIRFSGIPTVLVCNKLDLFQGDSSKLKFVVRAMRYLSHAYGTSLIFTSDHNAEVAKFRALINHVIFQLPFDPKHVQLDPERGGVLLTPDRDAFSEIGESPTGGESYATGSVQLDVWKNAFDSAYPPTQEEKLNTQDAFLKELYDQENGYGEPAVDSMRKQKDEELEQYRKNYLKKASKKTTEGTTAAEESTTTEKKKKKKENA